MRFPQTTSTIMQTTKKILRVLFPVLFWIGIWELAAWKLNNVLLFPNPRIVLKTLWELMQKKDFYIITANSLGNVLSGILLATLIGILLAILTYRISFLYDLFVPLMTVIKATPVASFIVLLLIWIGSDKVPSVITFLIVLPVVWTNLDEGLRQQDPKLSQVADIFGFSAIKRIRLLTIPSVRPYFLSACRSSFGLAWKAGVAAEIIAMPRETIGTMIGQAKLYLNTEEMFAWTLTVIVLSLLLELGIVKLIKRLEQKRMGGILHAEN